MYPKIDLAELWVTYTHLGAGKGDERDVCTECAVEWFELWSFPTREARILASLFLKPRSFNQLQWDVGFDAGEEKQAAEIRAILDRLIRDGFVVDGDPLTLPEHWKTVFLVINPTDVGRLRALLGVETPIEALLRLNPLIGEHW